MDLKLINLIVGVAVVGLVVLGHVGFAVGLLGGKIVFDHFIN
jgi:hypothetical protein